MAEYEIADVAFAVTNDLPDDATTSDVRDGLVWLPDGLTLEVDLAGNDTVRAGASLRHLVQWYGLVLAGESGLLPHAHGYWATSGDGDRTTLDLSERVIESDGGHRVVEPGPSVTGSRDAVAETLASPIGDVFGTLRSRGVDAAAVIADLAGSDVVDEARLDRWRSDD